MSTFAGKDLRSYPTKSAEVGPNPLALFQLSAGTESASRLPACGKCNGNIHT